LLLVADLDTWVKEGISDIQYKDGDRQRIGKNAIPQNLLLD
jgi:hypothetical protein